MDVSRVTSPAQASSAKPFLILGFVVAFGASALAQVTNTNSVADGPLSVSVCAWRTGVAQVLVSSRTNVIAYRPLRGQEFEARLFDARGKAVRKRRAGYAFGKPMVVDAELLDPLHHRIMNVVRDERTLRFPGDGGDLVQPFNLLQCFRVSKAGRYRLQVQVRLFTKDATGVFRPYLLPWGGTEVEFTEADIPPFIEWKSLWKLGCALSLCSAGLWLLWRWTTDSRDANSKTADSIQ
jgi:hypothetical protein